MSSNSNEVSNIMWIIFIDDLINILKTSNFMRLYYKYSKCKKNKEEIISYIVIQLKMTTNELLNYLYQNTDILSSIELSLSSMLDSKTFCKVYFEYIKDNNKMYKLYNYLIIKFENVRLRLIEIFLEFVPNTIALLELTGDGYTSNDIVVNKTFNYYWKNFNDEFKKFPVLNTESSIDKTLEMLEKYYNYGYRYFVGFSRSTMVNAVLDWFNMHQDATGISPTSTAPDLDIPKTIFRMTPTDNYIIEPALPYLYASPVVYYIYTEGENAMLNILEILENDPQIKELKTYAVNSTNLTVDNLKEFLKDSTELDTILLYLLDREPYIQLYSEGLTFDGQQFDILGIQTPLITGTSAIQLNNKYNVISYKGTCTSMLWRKGYKVLSENDYSIVSLNILYLLNELTSNNLVDNVYSHFGVLQFNPVSKDTIYPSFLMETFVDSKFINNNLTVNDPFLGQYQANFVKDQQIVVDEPIIRKIYKNNGKAIALLELTNSVIREDITIKESLYYYWYNDTNLPRFPIIDTETSISKTIELLNYYYNEGYRIFLGFTRSTVVEAVSPWFDSHPDATGISILSTASNIIIPKNFYRLDSSDDNAIRILEPILHTAPTVYYIYSFGETVAMDALKILQKDPKINLKSLGILPDDSNLTVSVLNEFLTGSTENDVILLILFPIQKYIDLYDQGLYFGGNQYDIVNIIQVRVEGNAQNILNDKFFNIQRVYVNTSLLWRENVSYLTDKYKLLTTSYTLINSLIMIDYILQNKSFDLLGSHLGTLEFNNNNTLKYPSYLARVYKEDVDNFVNFQLAFNDPLLGFFTATFV